MKITIVNRVGKPAKTLLEKNKYHVPFFTFGNERVFNGIVIDINDEDEEEFGEFFERNGYVYESDKEETDIKSTPKTSLHIP